MTLRSWEMGDLSKGLQESLADEVSRHVERAITEYVNDEDVAGLSLCDDGNVRFSIETVNFCVERLLSLQEMIDLIGEYHQDGSGIIQTDDGIEVAERIAKLLEDGASRLRAKVRKLRVA